MTDITEQVYQAIKEHNAKSPVIDGMKTSPVPAYTGNIKAITGLELDVIHKPPSKTADHLQGIKKTTQQVAFICLFIIII